MVKDLEELLSSPSPEKQWEAVQAPDFSLEDAFFLLKNRALHPSVIEYLARKRELMDRGRFKVLLVSHPNVPLHLGLDLIPHLLPMELLQVIKSPSTNPQIRKRAELALRDGMRKYPKGLRISMARQLPPSSHFVMLQERDLEVLKAFLQNPSLNLSSVLRLLERGDLPGEFYSYLYYKTRWGLRQEVKLKIALAKNSPIPLVLRIINELNRAQLLQLEKSPHQPDVILRRVRLLLGKEV